MTEPARRLLEHLRAELREPGLGYAELLTPIAGGYDTRIFAFRLSGAPEPFSIPLILRVLGSQHPPARALSERATQNALAGLGYPAPRVPLASPDPTILGGAFLVMERLAGRPLLDVRRLGVDTRGPGPRPRGAAGCPAGAARAARGRTAYPR